MNEFIRVWDVDQLLSLPVIFILQRLPAHWRLRSLAVTSRVLGRLWWAVAKWSRDLVHSNLRTVAGQQLSTAERAAAARGVFEVTVRNTLMKDLLPVLSAEEVRSLAVVEGREHLDAALQAGKGAILMGAHFGAHAFVSVLCLEAYGYQVMAMLGQSQPSPRSSLIYRRLVYPVRVQERVFLNAVDPDQGAQKAIIDCLRSNGVLYLHGDALLRAEAARESRFVVPIRLLGHTVFLRTSAFRIAHWLGSAVLPFFSVLHEDTWRLIIEEPIPLSSENGLESLAAELSLYAATLENYILTYPALWREWRRPELTDLFFSADDAASALQSQSGLEWPMPTVG